MATLFGRTYSRQELLRHVGDIAQIASVRPVELVNGAERGIRALEFRTGSGLCFTLLQDRAMDIYDAAFNGIPLYWQAPAGPVAPAFFDPHDIGWLYSMGGGLLTTCGLTHVGPAEVDEEIEEELGMHGRIGNLPARNVGFGAEWDGDEYLLWATGEVRESSLYGPNLLLRRSIHTRIGQSRIWIKDVVVNEGFAPAPLMFLYQCNAGFPVVAPGSELRAVIDNIEPRDELSAAGVEGFDQCEAPTAQTEEQYFYIDHDADARGAVNVALINPKFNEGQGIGLYLNYPKAELPHYTHWKMTGEGTYVIGLHPGNCLPEGRSSARQNGRLQLLDPGKSAAFHLEIGVLATPQDRAEFEARLQAAE
ncbi:MAG TPA: aldose 1-epimerase family protein [bacterium]|nr:aldose 1-epimerase family protein [bacterium]HQI49465.1 aldose 1-epimerase family protein [bacterium]HQJ63800.1 aldose 1-epimerase family protein [bacterium]